MMIHRHLESSAAGRSKTLPLDKCFYFSMWKSLNGKPRQVSCVLKIYTGGGFSEMLPPRNPRAAYRREAIAARRSGSGSCDCGESRPEALIPGSESPICYACDRRRNVRRLTDAHHIAGRSNSPIMILVPVNDHRSELSKAQYDWPKKTLQNPDRSPLLTGAAHLRGFADLMVYLLKSFLLWVADMLELLDTILEQKLGRKWWKNTKLKTFEPKSKSDA